MSTIRQTRPVYNKSQIRAKQNEKITKSRNPLPSTAKKVTKTQQLESQLNSQSEMIQSLKNLVVYKKSDDLNVKTDFDKKLQSFIGSTVADDIHRSLDDMAKQHNIVIMRREFAENKQSSIAAPMIPAKINQEKPKTTEKGCSTEDDHNILLAASNGSPLRLLGEICYEIEFRILDYVFGSSTTLYGVSTRQIEAKIRECSTNFMTLQPDYEKRDFLIKKYEEVLATLAEIGYKRQYHPSLTEHYITKFGHFSFDKMPVLNLSPDRYTRQLLKEIMRLNWSNYKTNEHQKSEWAEVKTLIDSLLKISEFDGKPLFSWEKRRVEADNRITGTAFL